MTVLAGDQNFDASWESPVRLRKDLEIATIRRGLQVSCVIKDPVNLKYFEFDEHEMSLIHQLDGRRNWDDICTWFNHRFPPLRLTRHALQSFVWRLGQQQLLYWDVPGQGRRLAQRQSHLRRQSWIQRLSQPWVIRLPGINPRPLMGLINSCLGWAFTPAFVGVASVVLLVLFSVFFSQHFLIRDLQSDSQAFLTRQNLVLLALVIAVTKVIHELGHAVCAYRHGCDCHEMGILLLAGLPSLYCDVSDAWILPSRAQRIAVSLAGIWLEVLISGAAAVIWMTSVPGIVHAISFNLMVVCSVGTLLFNANPLIRYDGYYVLMDGAGVSNLGQRSDEALDRFLTSWVLGASDLRPLDSPEAPRWCILYGAVAGLYRSFLTIGIVWGLYVALKPFSLGMAVCLLAVFGLTIWCRNMIKTAIVRVRRTLSTGTPLWRVLLGFTFVVTVFASCLTIQLPWYVFGQATIQPADQQTLVAAVSGRLIEHKDPGTVVDSGDVVARFGNLDLEREIQQLASELRIQNERLQALLARRIDDPRAAEQIPGTKALQATLKERLNLLQDERQRLELVARQTSVVYPAPIRLARPGAESLPQWSGSLLDSENRDASVNSGDLVCQLGTTDRMDAVTILAQEDMKAVGIGQRVNILLNSSGTVVTGEVAKISLVELDSVDEAMPDTLPSSNTDRRLGRRPIGKRYQIQVRCDSSLPLGTPIRSRGAVRIHVGSRTVYEWLSEQFFRTFRWHA